ncbi:MAG: hypothetical protein ACLP05_04905 [Candidatus Kryptoniota bacterium]
MSRFFYFCVATFLVVSICHAQGIDGKWKGEMQSPNGPMDLTFNFKVSGDSLSGTVATQMGEMPIIDGKVDGKKFSFDVSFNDMTMNHQCTFMGDSIAMKVPGMQGDTMQITLKRVPEPNDESK